MNFKNVDIAIKKFKDQTTLVIGDLILDHFLWGSAGRISPEAPVPVVLFEKEEYMPGGAGNVANNISALGGRSILLGVVGDDLNQKWLRESLHREGIDSFFPVVEEGRQTAKKTRVVAQRQQVVRVDRESLENIRSSTTKKLLDQFYTYLPSIGAVILTDYAKGLLTQELVSAVIEACNRDNVLLFFDPKPSHKIDFKGVSWLTPNRKETFELAKVADRTFHSDPLKDTNLQLAITTVQSLYQPKYLLSTLGEDGMLLSLPDGSQYHIPTLAQKVFDVSGAGDTVIATLALALQSGAMPQEAVEIANQAAGIVVGKLGTATVSVEELRTSMMG